MKRIISLVLVVMLLGTCGLLVGCGKSGSKNATNEKYTDAKGHELDGNLIGKWKCKFAGSDYVYTFKKDGTGVYDVAGSKMDICEWCTEKSTVKIKFNPDEASMDLKYKIKGDTLTIKDSLDNDVTYKRVD